MNCYWKIKDDSGEYYMVYVGKAVDQRKINFEPCATYHKKKKKIAEQYKIEVGSNREKILWERLSFTKKDEYKPTMISKKKVKK